MLRVVLGLGETKNTRLPVNSRARIGAWVIADTHMALVQLNSHVVCVPVIQEDPIIFSCGDLWRATRPTKRFKNAF